MSINRNRITILILIGIIAGLMYWAYRDVRHAARTPKTVQLYGSLPDRKAPLVPKTSPMKISSTPSGAAPSPEKTDLGGISVSKQKEIFAKLVHCEDMARQASEAYGVSRKELNRDLRKKICREFGISDEQLTEIGIKGNVEQWPMPSEVDWISLYEWVNRP